MKIDTTQILKDASFQFNHLVCSRHSVSLNTTDFLRWLFLEPARPDTEVINKFGVGPAWHSLKYGYVENPLDENDVPHWSLTTYGMDLLTELCRESLGKNRIQGIGGRLTST